MKRALMFFVVLEGIASAAFAQSGDPWIKEIYMSTWGRSPTAMEYNIQNYNGGHWGSKAELMKYVYEFQKNLNSAGIAFKYSKPIVGNKVVVGIFQNGTQIAADLISNDGGSIVAQGGGNIISTNGAGIVAQGGGNIVAQGGGNISVLPSTKGAGFGGAYGVLAAGTTVVKTSGSGAFIIK